MTAKLKILHVEDDPLDAELVQAVLKRSRLDFNIEVVRTGEQFEAALEKSRFDVILSDNSVSGLSGKEAFKLAKEKHPSTPFVLLSGALGLPGEGLSSVGADAYVSKTDLEHLAEAIQREVWRASPVPGGDSKWYQRGMERLVEVVQELSQARDLPRIREIVRKAARELTGADGATFLLREGDYSYYADENAIGPLWKGQRFPLNGCIGGWTMLHREAVVIEDVLADARVPQDVYRPTFVRSLVMVPIRTANPVGAIGNYWSAPRQPRPEEVRLLQALADSTSVAMENVRLYTNLQKIVDERTSRLEAANLELEAFSYSVSHDLRAPLRHIAGYVELLRNECGDRFGAKGERFANIIADSAARMGVLIDDLLAFSRMGRAPMKASTIDMNAMVAQCISETRAEAGSRVIDWRIETLPEVKADRAMLKQVWMNLIGNALKYTRPRGQAEIQVKATRLANEWQFSIQDNGVGFDNAHADRLFGVFQRLHRQEEFEGTGMGLALVRRIIARHGGRTWADGRLDVGTTTYFTIPDQPPWLDKEPLETEKPRFAPESVEGQSTALKP